MKITKRKIKLYQNRDTEIINFEIECITNTVNRRDVKQSYIHIFIEITETQLKLKFNI